MEYSISTLILFVSFTEYLVADLAGELLREVSWASGINLIFLPTILSGALALLVKYLAALRIVPVYKLVSGGLLVLLVSWYLDRICKNNSYLLVRSVGLGLVLCAGVGVVIISEERFAGRPELTAQRTAATQSVGEQEFFIARD